MTTFEYLAGAYTLILSFAVVRILASVPHAVQPGRRYWVHVSWLVLSIAHCLIAFWVFLSYREVEFTLPRFIAILAGPGLIYVYSSLVAPSDPSAVGSWRDYFFSVRVPLFASHFLLMVVVLFSNNVFLGSPIIGVATLPVQVLIVVSVAGLMSANPRLHTLLALGPPTLAVITVSMLAQPGSLTP
jgi:hypothetical protein